MKKNVLLVILFAGLCANSLLAQTCSCAQEFLWVKLYVEKNHPGFNSIIKTPINTAYKAFTDSLWKEIVADNEGRYCLWYLFKYMHYLKDNHSSITATGMDVNEESASSLGAFFRSKTWKKTEWVNIDSVKVINTIATTTDELEGIYTSEDSMYTVALLKNKTAQRDYYAVVLSSKTKVWVPGQVKFELKQTGNKQYTCLFYLRNHSLHVEEGLHLSGHVFAFNTGQWVKQFPIDSMALPPLSSKEKISNNIISFKVLDSITACLSVRSFSGAYNSQLDSAYKDIIPKIRKYPHLIIDVRNNGGGSDANYSALLPFIYTDTIVGDVVQLYATSDNINAYEKMRDEYKKDKLKYGEKGYLSWEFPLNRMRTARTDSFVYYTGNSMPRKVVLKPDKRAPKKVAILYNRFCASSCEQLLLDAMFSKKVIRVGEHSGGFIAYGNVMNIKTPCGNTLNWTTTQKVKSIQYEFVGIKPHFYVPEDEPDWLDYTRKLLQK
jgi:hypothetical protein